MSTSTSVWCPLPNLLEMSASLVDLAEVVTAGVTSMEEYKECDVVNGLDL